MVMLTEYSTVRTKSMKSRGILAGGSIPRGLIVCPRRSTERVPIAERIAYAADLRDRLEKKQTGDGRKTRTPTSRAEGREGGCAGIRRPSKVDPGIRAGEPQPGDDGDAPSQVRRPSAAKVKRILPSS